MRVVLCLLAALSCAALPQDASSTTSTCSPGYHMCHGSGICLPPYWVCDGTPDCPDGDDEDFCFTSSDVSSNTDASSTTSTCSPGYHMCHGSGICLPPYWVCDGTPDCPDGDDEDFCFTSSGIMTSTTTAATTTPPPQPTSTTTPSPQPTSTTTPSPQPTTTTTPSPQPTSTTTPSPQPTSTTTPPPQPTSTTTPPPQPTSTTTPPPQSPCDGAFDYIYDRCVFVDPFTSSTWDEGRYLWEKFNSDLVVLDDFGFYAELLNYINDKGLENHNYWVGATDEAEEGVWRWIDSSPVPSGAPLWALYGCTGDYHLEPRPGDADTQDCGFLDMGRGLYMSDASCDESFAAICQTPTNKKQTRD